MPVGVIISSNNLSGQTANVTFYPFSGGSINIGTVTIPFNYISPSPYGTYSIYVPLYNYTYTLTVYEPTTSTNQSFTWVSTPPLNDIWVRAILNYSEFTAELIQFTELPTSDWNITDLYPITERGYTYFFENISNSDHRYIVFTDSFGNVVGEYSAITNSISYLSLDGYYNAFVDYDNGVIGYSNGSNYNEFSWDNGVFNYETFENTYSSVYNYTTKNGSMVLRMYNYNTSEYYHYLLRPTSSQLLEIVPNDNSFSFYYINNYCSFIHKIYRDSGNTFSEIVELEDISGTTIDTTYLSANTFNYNFVYFYGDNKVGTVLFNQYDSNIDWFIHSFDRNINTTVLETHPRGSNYYFFESPSISSNEFNEITPGNNFYCLFYDTNFNNNNKLGYEVSYLNILSLFSGDSTFHSYTFQDSGLYDKTFQFNFSCSDDLIAICSTGDNVTTIFTLTNSGVEYIPTINSNDFDYINIFKFGNRFVLANRGVEVPNDSNLYMVEGNQLLDTLYLIPEYGYFNYYTYWNMFIYTDTNQHYYYVNSLVDNFTQLEKFDGFYGSPYVNWGLGHQVTTSALLNSDTGQMYLMGSNMYQGPFTLPINGGNYQLSLGRDKFLYVYQTPTWLGNYIINLYDFEFGLLLSEETQFLNTWDVRAAKDRYYVIFEQDNKYLLNLVSTTSIQTVEISDYGYNRTINDFTYWYD